MNRFRIFISKTFIPVITIFLQITLFMTMLLRFRNYLLTFYSLSYLLSLACVLWVVNSRMNPGFKLAWVIIILTFPFLGIAIYLFYGGKKSRMKMHRRMVSINSRLQSNLPEQNDELMILLKKEQPNAWLQANYIRQNTLCNLYRNSSCTYYSPGEAVYPVILEEL